MREIIQLKFSMLEMSVNSYISDQVLNIVAKTDAIGYEILMLVIIRVIVILLIKICEIRRTKISNIEIMSTPDFKV